MDGYTVNYRQIIDRLKERRYSHRDRMRKRKKKKRLHTHVYVFQYHQSNLEGPMTLSSLLLSYVGFMLSVLNLYWAIILALFTSLFLSFIFVKAFLLPIQCPILPIYPMFFSNAQHSSPFNGSSFNLIQFLLSSLSVSVSVS